MKRSLRVTVTAALLTCSAVAVWAVGAGAHTVGFNSHVTMGFQPGHREANDTFFGTVISAKPLCEQHRRVAVQRSVDGPDALVGTDFTDADGRWEVQVHDAPAGTYYARATRKVLVRSPGQHLHVCRPGISNEVKVHGG
jgi:hypothetical protein